MQNIRTALFYSAITGYGQRLFGLLSVIVVSRLLTPDEIGVYALAASVALVVSEFKTVGAGAYLVRQKTLNRGMIQSANGLMSIICWSAVIILFFSAPFFAKFYGVPDVKYLLWLCCINFVFAPSMSVIRAVLSREYEFKKIFFIVVTGRVINLILSVFLIIKGYSYFALGVSAALAAVSEFLLSLGLKPNNTPIIPSFSGLKPIAKFGVFVTLSNFFRKFCLVLPDILIGRRGTTAEVAVFSRGIGFLDFLFNSLQQGVSNVVLPYLADQKRQGHPMETSYLYATELLGVVVWPVLAVAGVAARPAILVFFGEQWEASTVLVLPLCIWMLMRSIHAFAPQVLITLGKERALFYKELVIFLMSGLAVWYCYPSGLSNIAWGLLAVGVSDFLLTSIVLKISLGFSWFRFLRSSIKNMLLLIVCTISAVGVDLWVGFDQAPEFYSMAVLVPIMGVVWITMVYVTKHPILTEVLRFIGKK